MNQLQACLPTKAETVGISVGILVSTARVPSAPQGRCPGLNGMTALLPPAPKPDGCVPYESCVPSQCSSATIESLNQDPYNIRAEELALQECMEGVEVRRTWSEREMVRSFGGRLFAGTPDGMFESWDGALICVQVVRVPLVRGMCPDVMQHTVSQTMLAKVVKSQQWLCASHIVPHEFVVFCWLPFSVTETVVDYAYALMQRLQALDPRFSLRLRTPADASVLFPPQFACNQELRVKAARSYSEGDVSTFNGSVEESDEDEACEWDITWAWEEDMAVLVEDESRNADGTESLGEETGKICVTSSALPGLRAGDDTDDDCRDSIVGDSSEGEGLATCGWNFIWDDCG